MTQIFLGDQSPWNGGQMRALVAAQEGFAVCYCRQDVDTPWVVDTRGSPAIQRGFTKYASLGVRIPWTLESPCTRLNAPAQSLGTPKGFQYIVGPNTTQTLWGIRKNAPSAYMENINNLCTDMLFAECAYAWRVAKLIGVMDQSWSREKRMAMVRESVTMKEQSLVEHFQDRPPRLLREIPASSFWQIDAETGERQPWDGTHRPSCIYVPKGKFLLLELAVRGFSIGYTSLPYLNAVREYRNTMLPGQQVRLTQIQFDWKLDPNPIDELLKEWEERRRKAGRKGVSVDPHALKTVCEYWAGRPTSMSYNMLGGDLNPTLSSKML